MKRIAAILLITTVVVTCSSCQLVVRSENDAKEDTDRDANTPEDIAKNTVKKAVKDAVIKESDDDDSAPQLKNKWPKTWAKAKEDKRGKQKIEVISPAGKVCRSFTNNEDIFSFIQYMDMDHWDYDQKSLPDKADPVCQIVYFEQKNGGVFKNSYSQALYKAGSDYYIASTKKTPLGTITHLLDHADQIPAEAGDFVSGLVK